jgi:two-component system chemotaxis response regulator CheB
MTHDLSTVLVAAGTVDYRNMVKCVLAGVPELDVLGVAANGEIALAKIDQLRPDILMLDLEMPGMGGLEVLWPLKQSGSEIGTFVLSGTTEHAASLTIEALELGAFDFVAKPIGGTCEENVRALAIELQPKIGAFARSLRVRKLLRCVARRDSGKVATAVLPSAEYKVGLAAQIWPVLTCRVEFSHDSRPRLPTRKYAAEVIGSDSQSAQVAFDCRDCA